jgi:deoxyribonuclease V
MNSWQTSPAAAIAVQRQLREKVILNPMDAIQVQRVAGVDVAFGNGEAWAAVVVLSYPDLSLVESAVAKRPVTFPYIPGLLSFREMPSVLAAWSTLRNIPDLVMVDGHGYAHPRRFGIACHLGVEVGLPAIGCAKSRLCGTPDMLALHRGATAELRDDGEVIGALLRTRKEISPVYVSIGNMVSLPMAIDFVLNCTKKYRLPEPTRQAHLAAGYARRKD